MSDVAPPDLPANVQPIEIQEEMEQSFLDYAMSVIVSRALPDARDGLKPVQRRILWSMFDQGVRPDRNHVKCATVVGDVIGKYHPHGDTSIYDALVRMGQHFSLRHLLIDPQGNFGSPSDDAAAMRYCLTGDARVRAVAGSPRIADLASTGEYAESPLDLKVLGNGGAPVLATKHFHSGSHPTLRIRTREGYELTGTQNHPVMTLQQVAGVPLLHWRLLQDIQPGDWVVLDRHDPGPATPSADDYEQFRRWSTSEVARSRNNDEPSIPEAVWQGSLGLKRAFLDALFEGESYATDSERLASDVQQLLLEFGIVSRQHRPEATDEIVLVVDSHRDGGEHYYAQVESVTDAGVQPVYSIRVDSDDHAFISNGFISHNTECKLSPLAMRLLDGIDQDTVNLSPNFDGRADEPDVLPARFPNLLVNGSQGIAVGMATNIPPHNLGEVVDAVVHLIDNPDATVEDLMQFVKGPDFPTGGLIMGRQGVVDAYTTGRGSVRMRAVAEIEEGPRSAQVVVTEIPYQTSIEGIEQKIADAVERKVLDGIRTLRNESAKGRTRFVIELKRDAPANVVLNNLYKYTPLQTSFAVNTVALIDGVRPRTLTLRDALVAYVDHQIEVITRRTEYRLERARFRAHIVEGLLRAIDAIDAIIELIRGSESRGEAREGLRTEPFSFSEDQAEFILELQLGRLTRLARLELDTELDGLRDTIAELDAILADDRRLRSVMKDELLEIREEHASPRKTQITFDPGEMDIEDLIDDEDLVVTMSGAGYIKTTAADAFRTQGRGGRGVQGAKLRDGDFISMLVATTAHAYLLLFTNRGRVFRLKAHEIPMKERTARGTAVVNLLNLDPDESVQAIIDTRDYETSRYLFFATKHGQVKKTKFTEYDTSRSGLKAINLKDDDELVRVAQTSGVDDIFLVSRNGQTCRFTEEHVRPMGRSTAGVRGMRLREGDEVVACAVGQEGASLFVITERGYGKQTPIDQYPRKGRGTMGVRGIQLTEDKGPVVTARMVMPGDELILASSSGTLIRTAVDGISSQGRGASGVRVMSVGDDETVAAIAPVVTEDDSG